MRLFPPKASAFLRKLAKNSSKLLLHIRVTTRKPRSIISKLPCIAPDFAEAFSFRGFVEISANRFDAAMDDLQHSLRADPALPITYLYMGSLLNHLGRYDEALASLDRNAQFDPRSWSCAYERARSWLGKHEYEHALVEINRAVALGAEARMGNALRILRGNALYGLKQYDQATAELQAYLSAEPDGKLASVARDLMSHIDRDAIVAEK